MERQLNQLPENKSKDYLFVTRCHELTYTVCVSLTDIEIGLQQKSAVLLLEAELHEGGRPIKEAGQ